MLRFAMVFCNTTWFNDVSHMRVNEILVTEMVTTTNREVTVPTLEVTIQKSRNYLTYCMTNLPNWGLKYVIFKDFILEQLDQGYNSHKK